MKLINFQQEDVYKMRDFNEKERESYNKIVEDFSENVVILSEKEYNEL